MPSNNLVAGLTKVAQLFVTKMKQRLDSGGYPSGGGDRGLSSIQDATSIETPVVRNLDLSVDVVIDLKKAPYAAAYEWGSGLTSELEPPARYLIAPVNASMLAFPWQIAQNIAAGRPPGANPPTIVLTPEGKAILPSVKHPGIKGKPYIRPTIIEVTPEAITILGLAFKATLLVGVPKVTII